jgi:hypothetical protein
MGIAALYPSYGLSSPGIGTDVAGDGVMRLSVP